MLSGRRGGERRRRSPSGRNHHDRPPCRSRIGDASFSRSRGPCTSIVTQLRRRKSEEVARSGWYRGRANPRKGEEPAPGPSRTDGARLAACHHGPARGAAGHVRKGRRLRPSSLRGFRRVRVWLLVRRLRSCRSRQAAHGLEYARVRSCKNSHRGSERRPSPRQSSAVKRRRGSRAKGRRDVERHRSHGARIGAGPG